MRRARMPTICRTTIGTPPWSSVISVCSFRSPASGRYAGRKLPGWYFTEATRPDTGIRLTCTSIGERKIVIWRQSPAAKLPVGSPATITRPSAGDTTSPGAAATLALRVTEEEQKKGRKQQGDDAVCASGQRGHEGRHAESNSYERPTGRVDAHLARSSSIVPYPAAAGAAPPAGWAPPVGVRMSWSDDRAPTRGRFVPFGP